MQTEIEKLPELVEAILFVAGQGVELKDIAEKLEVDVKQISKAIEELKIKHENDGINIITYKNSAQMCSNSIYAEDIAVVLNPIREKQLTKAALETLAIIAYKQPITRLEIEQVRNVNSDYAMQVLTNFKLVEIVGRKDAVGKPLLYGTTDEFLKHFNLQDINDLPDYDEILERIEIIHAEDTKGDSLYGSTEIIPEEQLKDALNQTNNSDDNSNVTEQDAQNNNVITMQSNDNISQDDNANTNTDQSFTPNNDMSDDQMKIEEENKEVNSLNDSDTTDDAGKIVIDSNENLEEIKNTLLNANSEDENAIIDSFKDSDTL